MNKEIEIQIKPVPVNFESPLSNEESEIAIALFTNETNSEGGDGGL